jgi:hypothetical protein
LFLRRCRRCRRRRERPVEEEGRMLEVRCRWRRRRRPSEEVGEVAEGGHRGGVEDR